MNTSGNSVLTKIMSLVKTWMPSTFTMIVNIMTAIRVASVVQCILFLWIYAGTYVTAGGKNNQIGEYIKRVASLCVSQFYIIVMYEIFLLFGVKNMNGPYFYFNIAWIIMTITGSGVIRNMIDKTGVSDAAAGGARAVGGVLRRIG